MSDLIRREDAIEVVCELVPIRNDAVEIADAIRAISSAERKGEWIDNGDRYFRCSLCGTKDTDKWRWCHGCGNPMKGAEDEDR